MFYKKPKFWDKKNKTILCILLSPITFLILIFIKLKNLRTRKKYSFPIICVGNIYLGGTGKTPLSIEIFKVCKKFGKKAAFVKKFYPYLKDEIRLLKKYSKVFSDQSRIVSLNRMEKENFDIAILDDGFQDASIEKKYSIICFNSKQWIGNGLVIPSGPLRENLSALERANCVFINGKYNKSFNNFLLKINKHLKIFYYKYKILNLKTFKKNKVIAFAGIGNPTNFFSTLRENGLKLIETISFPDHYDFSKKDLDNLINKSNLKGAKLITTEKDYHRLNNKYKSHINYAQTKLVIGNKTYFEKTIQKQI